MKTPPPFSQKAKELQQGVYEHYKGNRYQLLDIARHSETLEEYVVYKALYGAGDTWIRPLSMFLETVWVVGKGKVPRFRLVSKNPDG